MQSTELPAVTGPYITLALLYIVIAFAIALVRVPKHDGLVADRPRAATPLPGSRFSRLLRNRRYALGVLAQFFNVAAQTCTCTFTLYSLSLIPI